MPMDKARITGFGSDGFKPKNWRCHSGHLLQPWKATDPGTCDGCKTKVQKGDSAMDCRQCNFYLCEDCHPQEKHSEDWFWGSVSYFAGAASEVTEFWASEFNEICGDVENFVAEKSPFAACGAPQVCKDDVDLTIDASREKKVPRRPAASEEEVVGPGSDRDDDDLSSTASILMKGNKKAQPREAPKETAPKETEAQKGAVKQQETEEEVTEKPVAPVEDLMDIGQQDLLDLDVEPTPIRKAASPEAELGDLFPSSAPAPIFQSPPAVVLESIQSLEQALAGGAGLPSANVAPLPDLLLDMGGEAARSPAPAIATALAAPATGTPALPSQDLLDF